MENRRRRIAVARGDQPADLVLKNANVVNVYTGEVVPADVAVVDGVIAGLGSYTAARQRDCTGLYLAPGFIDAHLHVESAMVLPGQLARAVLPWGTTTLVADPHEIVNVCGPQGMRYMLKASEGVPLNLYYMLPSSVPATPFETAGAEFTATDMHPFLDHPRVLGLGEAMCFADVVAGGEEIMAKLEALAGRPVDGHAPGLTGPALQAYVAAGISSEHECTGFAEALEKARAGLAILVREGSAAHNLKAIVDGLVESGLPTGDFMFCTDDKHLDDIERDGHIRWNVKLAVDCGMAPVDAIRMATLNPARHYGLQGLGAVAPGKRADLVLLDSLKALNVVDVYKDGLPAADRIAGIQNAAPRDEAIFHSVKAPRVTARDFRLPLPEIAPVIEMVPYQLVTRRLDIPVPRDGEGCFAPGEGLVKLCVVERHGKTGAVQAAPLKGYGIMGGAIATTVAHDSHNILVAGDNDVDIALAVNRLTEIDGGYVLVQNGRVAGEVSLPVAGLMSDRPYEEVSAGVGELIKKAHEMGIPYYNDPFISLSFLALPVIPALRLTDKGLFEFGHGFVL